MQNKKLHLIEPTLFDQTGHGFSYAHSLVQANSEFGFDLQLWIDQRANNLFSKEQVTTHTYFIRSIRQVQKIALYLKLLRQGGIIFVSTCDLWDLKILSFYTRLCGKNSRIFLHFHQFKQTTTKLAALRKIAKHCRNITILTPTSKLAKIFTNNGFRNCTVVPCPTFTPVRNAITHEAKFSKILYAGAARSDKGFATVIQLLQFMRENNSKLPFEIQISAPNSQRYDQDTTNALQMLENITKNNLTLHKDTLNQDQYLSLFNNAICLLLYDQNSYQDKFSGIALDAFYAGCPIITVKNTWMGDTAEFYGAGIALEDLSVTAISNAITAIIADYATYTAKAKIAAVALQKLHDPKNTLVAIQSVVRLTEQPQTA